MIYDLPLRPVALTAGLLLLLTHALALWAREPVGRWLRALPRSRAWGTGLCLTACGWAFWLAATMDLGEFSPSRGALLVLIAAAAVMLPLFVEELLAARALGFLALLAAEPLLDAAFLRPETSRLLLVCLAYAWAVAGILLVGAPYLLRDAVTWVTATRTRWTVTAWAGLAYGAALAGSAIFLHSS